MPQLVGLLFEIILVAKHLQNRFGALGATTFFWVPAFAPAWMIYAMRCASASLVFSLTHLSASSLRKAATTFFKGVPFRVLGSHSDVDHREILRVTYSHGLYTDNGIATLRS